VITAGEARAMLKPRDVAARASKAREELS
jgi:hypothetical protein